MIRSGFVLAMLAAPATAQDLPFDAGPLAACVEAAEGRVDALACVGMAADACINAPGGYTTVGMGSCYGYELDYWKERLTTAYNKLEESHKQVDEQSATFEPRPPSLTDALREMQQAWTHFRDAACNYERANWGGGSGGGPASAACMMEITAQQAITLEARLQEYEQ